MTTTDTKAPSLLHHSVERMIVVVLTVGMVCNEIGGDCLHKQVSGPTWWEETDGDHTHWPIPLR